MILKVFIDPSGKGGLDSPKLPSDAGYDLRSAWSQVIFPGEMEILDTGVHVELPEDHCGLIVGRSGLNLRGIVCLVGLIDAGYRGQIRVALHNAGKTVLQIEASDRIAQMLIIPVATPSLAKVASLSDLAPSVRSTAGFGSTGTN